MNIGVLLDVHVVTKYLEPESEGEDLRDRVQVHYGQIVRAAGEGGDLRDRVQVLVACGT